MWDDREGQGNSEGGNGEVYWRSCPEFSHLANYHPPSPPNNQQQTDIPLKSKISDILALNKKDEQMSTGGVEKARKEVEEVVGDALLGFLSRTLGFAAETFDEGQELAVYGLDSLSAVGVQYWGWRELSINITVAEVFAAPSIKHLAAMMSERVIEVMPGQCKATSQGP
ncbi:MAG: hypothetical protein Q9204_009448 [Flavoplaca sp. TL-2023a]